jgi:hypothetical protein
MHAQDPPKCTLRQRRSLISPIATCDRLLELARLGVRRFRAPMHADGVLAKVKHATHAVASRRGGGPRGRESVQLCVAR